MEPVINGQTINGTNGNNFLPGSNLNDRIDGLGGSDHLIGDGGTDILTGGAGGDRFSGTLADFDGDWLTDFGLGGDRITVRGASFTQDALDVVRNGSQTVLEIDVGSDGSVESRLVLQGDFAGTFNVSPSASTTDINYDPSTVV